MIVVAIVAGMFILWKIDDGHLVKGEGLGGFSATQKPLAHTPNERLAHYNVEESSVDPNYSTAIKNPESLSNDWVPGEINRVSNEIVF
jgi:hypothetical protein